MPTFQCDDRNQTVIGDQNSCNPIDYTPEERQEALKLSNEHAARTDKPLEEDPWGNALAAGFVGGPIGALRAGVAGTAEEFAGEYVKDLAFEGGKALIEDATDVPSMQERAEAAEEAEAQRRLEEGATANSLNSCQDAEVEVCDDGYDPNRNSSQQDP